MARTALAARVSFVADAAKSDVAHAHVDLPHIVEHPIEDVRSVRLDIVAATQIAEVGALRFGNAVGPLCDIPGEIEDEVRAQIARCARDCSATRETADDMRKRWRGRMTPRKVSQREWIQPIAGKLDAAAHGFLPLLT